MGETLNCLGVAFKGQPEALYSQSEFKIQDGVCFREIIALSLDSSLTIHVILDKSVNFPKLHLLHL